MNHPNTSKFNSGINYLPDISFPLKYILSKYFCNGRLSEFKMFVIIM